MGGISGNLINFIFTSSSKLPLGATKESVLKTLPSLGYFTEHQWTFPRSQDLRMIDQVLQLNNYTIELAIDELGMICEDFILVCYWAGKKFPCFAKHAFLGWIGSTSHYGACCSFNYHPNVRGSKEPFVANTYGMHGGLSVIGTGYPQASDGKSGALYSEGFMVGYDRRLIIPVQGANVISLSNKLMIHHPHDFAVEASPLTLIRLRKETFVNVLPTDSRCSEQVLALPQNQRDCIVGSDFNPPIANYRQPACTLQCLRNEVHRKCGCHPFHLPQPTDRGPGQRVRNCTVYDSMCFVENYYMFKRLKCNCLPSCSDVTYKTASIVSDFSAYNFSINPFYKETNLSDFEFIFHIFMSNQVVAANRRIVVVSWISLLSNLGGAFSLCLGISVLSLFEVLFFTAFRLRKMYYQRKQRKEQQIKLVAPFARLQRF
ncbi:sodium channel protein Nach-like [Anopheles funestus]|uniref:sodium channel protein Nach-like n=1 Tax=Anopheles funestus TaxID=62324 RepID=UPI0020C66641|nr:sodium channel protein Nach-like [Anopheles funestus]